MSFSYGPYVRTVPHFPQPGVMFRDITPLLRDPVAFQMAVRDLASPFTTQEINAVVAVESRGFLLGGPVAYELQAGLVPVRKIGKLPHQTYQAQYALEYGDASIEMHRDALGRHHRVLVLDDVLATGGTLEATLHLVERSGANAVGVAVLIELSALGGRSRLRGLPCHSLIQY